MEIGKPNWQYGQTGYLGPSFFLQGMNLYSATAKRDQLSNKGNLQRNNIECANLRAGFWKCLAGRQPALLWQPKCQHGWQINLQSRGIVAYAGICLKIAPIAFLISSSNKTRKPWHCETLHGFSRLCAAVGSVPVCSFLVTRHAATRRAGQGCPVAGWLKKLSTAWLSFRESRDV